MAQRSRLQIMSMPLDQATAVKNVAPPCVRCGIATWATCRVCGAWACGNCVLTPQHEATHE